MTTISGHTTRASGTVLTAAIYNADHTNHIANATALNASKLEGATPPVVDGHAVVWLGTGAASLKSAGYAPANAARILTAGSGLAGGGDLTADRTFSVDFASQAEAEAGSSTTDVMSPLRVAQHITFIQASLAEAQAGTSNTKLMTPLRSQDFVTAIQASQAEAEAGSSNTKLMTPLRSAQAIAALASSIDIGSATVSIITGGVDMGVTGGTIKAAYLIGGLANTATTHGMTVSLNGGTNYSTVYSFNPDAEGSSWCIVFIEAGVVAALAVTNDQNTSGSGILNSIGNILRVVPTAGAGNLFFKSTGVSFTALRVI